jgi:uncharacterized protein
MQWVLDGAAAQVRRRPGAVLVVLGLCTLLFALAATRIQVGVDIGDYGTGTEVADAFERVTEEFGTRNATVTVVVDAGEQGSVLDRDGLRLARELRVAIEQSEAGDALAPDGALTPAVLSWALPVEQGLALADAELEELDDEELALLRSVAFDTPAAARAAALLAEDADPEAGEARGGLLIVRLHPDLDEEQRTEASLAVDRALGAVDGPQRSVLPFNQALLTEELEQALADEVPVLLAVALALITVILALAFRRVSDVLLALTGVAVTLVWLFGLVALLGPGLLGVTGPFQQIAIAVPVLLIGLSVDYSFHLTMRYREERAQQAHADEAAATAVRTVGRALVLVTLTTAIGFLANVISPLPPIVDFAVFAAAGMVATLVVMGFGVPAARHLLDRRRDATEAPREQAGKVVAAMALASRASARHPAPVLAGLVVGAGFGVVAGINLPTEFDQEQFVPDGTRVAQIFEVTEELFGGTIDEQTWILVDGDTADPVLADAVLATGRALPDVRHVQTVDGEARVTSPPDLVVQLARTAEAEIPVGNLPDDVDQQLQVAGWTGAGFADDADMVALYDLVDEHLPGRLDGVLSDDGDSMVISVETQAGDEDVDELVAALGEAVEPVEQAGGQTVVVSEQLLSQQTLDELTASQAQKILFTVLAAGALLIAYYRLARGEAMLGFITLVPTLLALPLVLGGMWVFGFSFNALTVTIAAIAIGFGVDYGIHLGNRFAEEREQSEDAAEAIGGTVVHTGAALVASSTTTAGGLAVLLLGDIEPIRQFGAITAMTIVVAVVATLFAQTSALVLWERARARSRANAPTRPAEGRSPPG